MTCNTRKKLINAALELFSNKGYHGTTMDDIAQKANVAKGTVYYNFPSKAALFAELVVEGINYILNRVELKLNNEEKRSEQIREIINLLIGICFKYDNLAIILFHELGNSLDKEVKKVIEARMKKLVKYIEEIIAYGVKQGEFKKIDPKITAAALLGTINGVFSSYIKIPAKQRVENEKIVEQVQTIILQGISKENIDKNK